MSFKTSEASDALYIKYINGNPVIIYSLLFIFVGTVIIYLSSINLFGGYRRAVMSSAAVTILNAIVYVFIP